MLNKKFILCSNCIPVKGAVRSGIADLQNNDFHFIPNGLYDILMSFNGKTINEIYAHYDHEYNKIIDDYFDFLIFKHLIIFSNNPEFFAKLSLEWDSPSTITNAIIDYDTVFHDYKSILEQLESLKCTHLQLRFFRRFELNYINRFLEYIDRRKLRFKSIEIIMPYFDGCDEVLLNLICNNPRIFSIVLFDSPEEKIHEKQWKYMGYLSYITKTINDESHCGIIDNSYFNSNVKLFSESQTHNTCLNRKVAIDKKGNIKNCPSMAQSFGNISETCLSKALNHSKFKDYWNITKDHIEICKDCEFRYICTDCRAYTERTKFGKENIDLSKPLKCGYNPYTNEWTEWSTNPLKKGAIAYYDLCEMKGKND